MTTQVISDAELMREVEEILLQHLNPTKVARFWAGWHTGQGSYMDWRDEAFAGKTLDELYEEILADQTQSANDGE